MFNNRNEVTAAILNAKREKGLSFTDIAMMLDRSDVWSTAICLGQMPASQSEASRIVNILSLPSDAAQWLMIVPERGTPTDLILQEPFLQRLFEVVSVYGPALKELTVEKFGDGIMSTTQFTLSLNKVEDPKGDQIGIEMKGKFLPFKPF